MILSFLHSHQISSYFPQRIGILQNKCSKKRWNEKGVTTQWAHCGHGKNPSLEILGVPRIIQTQFNGFNPQQFKLDKSLNLGNPKIRWFYQPFPQKKPSPYPKSSILGEFSILCFPLIFAKKPAVSAWAPVVCLFAPGRPGHNTKSSHSLQRKHSPTIGDTAPAESLMAAKQNARKIPRKRGRTRMILRKQSGWKCGCYCCGFSDFSNYQFQIEKSQETSSSKSFIGKKIGFL